MSEAGRGRAAPARVEWRHVEMTPTQGAGLFPNLLTGASTAREGAVASGTGQRGSVVTHADRPARQWSWFVGVLVRTSVLVVVLSP